MLLPRRWAKNALHFVVLNKSPDQPFHERMRQGRVRHRFDILHFEHPEIGLPLVEPEQRIVIRNETSEVVRQENLF